MNKLVLFSIAALASLAGAAIAQTPELEPAWRKSALALMPAGYVGGDAYRTDEAAMTGYLAVESEYGVRGWWRSCAPNR